MADAVLYKGWTERSLRKGLQLASPRAQAVLAYIAQNPRCTSAEIAESLGLKSERSVGPTLSGFSRAVAELGVRDRDGRFRWPLDFPGRRGRYELYDMPDSVRTIVLEVLGNR
jgi:hypothetical protein